MENMENAARKKVMLSGIQPSGDLTLGSYLGAIKNWAERDEEFDNYYFMASMHSITVRSGPCGAAPPHARAAGAVHRPAAWTPRRNTLFIQSHVPQHAELGWVLNCYTMFGELSRMTQFKDKSAKNSENINGGLFTYPGADGGGYPALSARLCPCGRGSEAACRALPQHRPALQRASMATSSRCPSRTFQRSVRA